MEYQLIEKEAFDVVGITRTFPCGNGEHLQLIPQLWIESGASGTTTRICAHGQGNPPLGIVLAMNSTDQTVTYMIAVQPSTKSGTNLVTEDSLSPEMNGEQATFDHVTIPASKWAIFPGRGAMPAAIQQLFAQIYGEWFPASQIQRAAGPEIECYLPGDPNDPDYPFEIWIPVVS